jgi:hypothetical protein
VASSTLIDEIRRRAREGFWRFTIAVAAEDGDEAAAERRLQVALSVLAEAGIDASGLVVRGDPFAAAEAVLQDEEVHEIVLATYPTGTSGWMADDTLDRLRKSVNVPVTRVVVRPEEAREPLTRAGVSQIAVIADEALGGEALSAALRERADRGPIAVVLLAPMALEGPGWTDEAEALRVATSERVRAAIDGLQGAGIQARGEVLDGDAAAAARVARSAYSAETILIVATRGSRLDSEEALAAVQAAAGGATVERVVVDAEAPTSPAGS